MRKKRVKKKRPPDPFAELRAAAPMRLGPCKNTRVSSPAGGFHEEFNGTAVLLLKGNAFLWVSWTPK